MHPAESKQTPPVALMRHIVPVLAGAVVTILLTVVTDSWLGARGVAPPLALAAGYRGLFTFLGGHLAARLAPAGQPRIRYAMTLAGLLTVMNVAGALSVGGQVPTWYLLAGIALPLPCAIVGGATAARAMAVDRRGNSSS